MIILILTASMLISVVPVNPVSASLDLYILDGWESGDELAWTGSDSNGGTSTVGSSYPYDGDYHLYCTLNSGQNQGWAGDYLDIDGCDDIMYVSGYVDFNNLPDTSGEDQFCFAFLDQSDANALVYAGVRNSGGTLYWVLWYRDSGSFYYSYGNEFADEGYVFVQLGIHRDTSSNGWVKLYVDNELMISETGIDHSRQMDYVRVGYSYSDAQASSSSSIRIDNARVTNFYFEDLHFEPNSACGYSSYPTSTAELWNIEQHMNYDGCTLYRMSFNPSWWATQPHPYDEDLIDWFLTYTYYTIIIDRNHLYPPTEAMSNQFITNIETAENDLLDTLETYGNNSRVLIELVNEYVLSDWQEVNQNLTDAIRDAGYTNGIVANLWNTPWSSSRIVDPIDNIYLGMHFYFDSSSGPSWTNASAVTQMGWALAQDYKVLNTEVGAHVDGQNYFNYTNVGELQDFVDWCYDNDINNCIWQYEDEDYYSEYADCGFDYPTPKGTALYVNSYGPDECTITYPAQWVEVDFDIGGGIAEWGEGYEIAGPDSYDLVEDYPFNVIDYTWDGYTLNICLKRAESHQYGFTLELWITDCEETSWIQCDLDVTVDYT